MVREVRERERGVGNRGVEGEREERAERGGVKVWMEAARGGEEGLEREGREEVGGVWVVPEGT